jgi:hypothetical protein
MTGSLPERAARISGVRPRSSCQLREARASCGVKKCFAVSLFGRADRNGRGVAVVGGGSPVLGNQPPKNNGSLANTVHAAKSTSPAPSQERHRCRDSSPARRAGSRACSDQAHNAPRVPTPSQRCLETQQPTEAFAPCERRRCQNRPRRRWPEWRAPVPPSLHHRGRHLRAWRTERTT